MIHATDIIAYIYAGEAFHPHCINENEFNEPESVGVVFADASDFMDAGFVCGICHDLIWED